MVTLTTLVASRQDLPSCDLGGDGLVVLDPKAGVYLGFEGPAAVIWSTLTRPVSIQAVCDVVEREYDVDRPRCEADTLAFIEDLIRRELVVIDQPAAGTHGA